MCCRGETPPHSERTHAECIQPVPPPHPLPCPNITLPILTEEEEQYDWTQPARSILDEIRRNQDGEGEDKDEETEKENENAEKQEESDPTMTEAVTAQST